MNVELNYEQRAHLELISVHSGKSTAQLLVEAAEFLLTLDPEYLGHSAATKPQTFLSDAEMETRFARLLHN
jgi:hypothetical protein